MKNMLHLLTIGFIWLCTSCAWMVLGAVMTERTTGTEYDLEGSVGELWGRELRQAAPQVNFHWWDFEDRDVERTRDDGVKYTTTERVRVERSETVYPISTRIDVDLREDVRRKGLLWFPLYDVAFRGDYVYRHDDTRDGWITVHHTFPDANGFYDGFSLRVNGEEKGNDAVVAYGAATVSTAVVTGQEVPFTVSYGSRGSGTFVYDLVNGVGQVEDFDLSMSTDFEEIDFPAYTMSPTSKNQEGDGWALSWTFDRLVTGHGIGMVVPRPIQPGPLAASMTFSAPIPLALFTLWIVVLGLLRGVNLHPMNHFFLAGAFFAFHLLFGYTADHLPVEWAFGLSSVVSVFLVVSYLRIVAGSRFAVLQAGLAQTVYLVGFSLAHFWDGFTGLTVTVLGIGTLFALMQLTARINWNEVFAMRPVVRTASPEAAAGLIS